MRLMRKAMRAVADEIRVTRAGVTGVRRHLTENVRSVRRRVQALEGADAPVQAG